MIVRGRAAAIAAAIALAASSAGAQPEARPTDADADAERHIDEAEAAHHRGDYSAAIEHFQAAYQRTGEPWLLFNIAQAHRLGGNRDAALWNYRRFVDLAPEHELAGEARENITRLEREQVATAPTEPGPTPAPRPPVHSSPMLVDQPARSRSWLLWSGVGVSAAGLAATAVGIAYGVRAKRATDAVNDHRMGAWTDELLERQREGRSAERAMYVLVGSGAVALTGGAMMIAFGWSRSTTAVSPTMGPGGVVGMTWTRAF